MDFWSDWSHERQALAVVAVIAASILIGLVVSALRDAANAMLISTDELKRDQAADERRRRLRILQRRREKRRVS
jgi:hypothetical protein